MRTRLPFALGVLVMMIVAAIGCSRNDGRSTAGAAGAFSNPMAPVAETAAPPDSNPGGPHPHPGPPPPTPAVVFISADSAFAGDSTATRWQLSNDSPRSFTMPWTLTSVRNWPGFPKSGSVALAPRGTQLLVVAVAVPDTAAAGGAPLLMTVTQRNGSTASASGAIQVSPGP